jgi:ubiquinone/menaquinone biosynthesis C-methylase UbiE
MRHNRIIRKEFSKQAAKFGDKELTLSSQDILNWIVENLPLDKDLRVLDVAAGTGHLGRAVAPHVREVIAIDITREMLNQARLENRKAEFQNIFLQEGSAENLPHQGDTFDLVVSRLSIHHFENPIIPLREMVRVCKASHRIGIIDLLSPEDPMVSETYNDLERQRDPSHTMALSKQQMERIVAQVGIFVEKIEIRDVEVDFQRWVQMTETKAETVKLIREELLKDVDHGSKTGMRPFLKNGDLKFLQVWSVIVGTKSQIHGV